MSVNFNVGGAALIYAFPLLKMLGTDCSLRLPKRPIAALTVMVQPITLHGFAAPNARVAELADALG